MELTLDELLKGKATMIKGKEYFSTEAYVTPFIERMSKFTNDFRIQAKLPDQISITKKEDLNLEDTVFNRVWIQAVLPDEFAFNNHQEVIGMVYGLDTRKPVFKIYRGALNMACLNLCVFNPSFLSVQEIEPEKALNYQPIIRLMEETSDIKAWLEKLSNTLIPYDEQLINENLGQWVRNSITSSYDTGFNKVKLATSMPIDAYKLLYEKKDSPYYVKPGDETDMFNVYNAFTELISNDGTKEGGAKDILNKCEKTLLLKNILTL
jgi:hypothetical protein